MQGFQRTATNIIAVVTAAAFLIAYLSDQNNLAASVFGFIPARFSLSATPFPAAPFFLTPLTATLVHAGPWHLISNLLFLIWCGSQVERVLGATGIIVLYVVGAYAAAVTQFGLNPIATDPIVGASGAISALMGAFALSFGRAKPFTRNLRINRWINVVWLLVAWVLLQMATSWLAGTRGVLLATGAHIGGFAAGLLLQRPLLLWRYRKA